MGKPQRLALALISVSMLLAACAHATGTSTQRATPTRAATATPAPTLLFQADWSHGAGAWDISHGWHVDGGSLISTISPQTITSIPYRPTVSNYAVEFDLQVIDSVPPRQGAAEFHLVVPQSSGADGFDFSLGGLQPAGNYAAGNYSAIGLQLDPLFPEAQWGLNVIGADFPSGTNWRTYRLEVRGPTVFVFEASHAIFDLTSSHSDHMSTGPVQLSTRYASVALANVRVYAL